LGAGLSGGGQLMANIIDVARQTRDMTMTRSMTSLFHLLHPSSTMTSPTQRLARPARSMPATAAAAAAANRAP